MSCEECRDLGTHAFRSADDLVHAAQVAAAEVDRGVLRRIDGEDRAPRVSEALASAWASSAVPGSIRYRFECTQCGDRFELAGDTQTGTGGWARLP